MYFYLNVYAYRSVRQNEKIYAFRTIVCLTVFNEC